MDWAGWITFGLVATSALTAIMVAAQLAGLSRMDMPMLLGTMFVASPDRARLLGMLLHLATGQAFALVYASAFALMGAASVWVGALFGLLHGLAALTVIVPVLPAVHPKMTSERSGPALPVALEPPGLLALNYGLQTPLVTLVAHVVYGALLGMFLQPR